MDSNLSEVCPDLEKKNYELCLKIPTVSRKYVGIYPLKNQVKEIIEEWLTRIMGHKYEDKDKNCGLCSYMYPDCTNHDLMILISKFTVIFILIDDDLDNNLQTDNNWINLFEEKTVMEESALRRAFREVWNDLKKELTPRQKERIFNAFFIWIKATEKIKSNKSIESVFSFEDYLNLRIEDHFYETWVIFIELIFGFEIKDEVLENQLMKDFFRKCKEFTALTNDLYSFEKEYFGTGIKMNAVWIISKLNTCDFQTAIDLVVNKLHILEEDISDLKNKIIESKIDVSLDYLVAAEKAAHGCENYLKDSPRYEGEIVKHSKISSN